MTFGVLFAFVSTQRRFLFHCSPTLENQPDFVTRRKTSWRRRESVNETAALVVVKVHDDGRQFYRFFAATVPDTKSLCRFQFHVQINVSSSTPTRNNKFQYSNQSLNKCEGIKTVACSVSGDFSFTAGCKPVERLSLCVHLDNFC